MHFKRHIKEFLSRFGAKPQLEKSFIYPYSKDKDLKRKEIWSNLQKGILLEDTQTFIPWEMPFNQITQHSKKRRDTGDRTEWYFGERIIFDGYKCHAEAMMWTWLPWTNPVTEISEKIGFDWQGEKKFHELRTYLTELLGDPTETKIEKWGKIDLGEVLWVNGKVKISLIGFEMHNARYNLNIGLVKDKNQEYQDKVIEDLKAGGLTEEELGK